MVGERTSVLRGLNMLNLSAWPRIAGSPLQTVPLRSEHLARRSTRMGLLLVAGLTLALLTSLRGATSVDETIIEAVQSVLPSWYADIGDFFNLFVRDTLIPLLWASSVIWLLWLRRHDLAGMFVLTATVGLFTNLLKQTIDRPRPTGDFNILQFPTDPSFPSGHTMTAMAFFGLWFLLSPNVLPSWAVVPARVACAGAVFFTGLSRMWAGAHWPSDVLGSLIWGSFFLLAVLSTQPLLSRLNPPRSAASE